METELDPRDFISYDVATGDFYWKLRERSRFSSDLRFSGWNERFAGQKIAVREKRGYLTLRVRRKEYMVHRLIWYFTYGEWPNEIDHINGNRRDNRIENLRNGDRTLNNRNLRCTRNRNGHPGIVEYGESWTAYIGRERTYLGNFKTCEEAIAARKAAEKRLGYGPNHGAPHPVDNTPHGSLPGGDAGGS